MISKAQIKHIRSLHLKKNREEEGLFLAEGEKIVDELLNSTMEIHSLFATKEWISENSGKLKNSSSETVSEKELSQISALVTPNKVFALVKYSKKKFAISELKGFSLMLDQISDPGNMGTILRLADWFGISSIICSEDCVELFNPKVVQASMGSCFRMNVYTESLTSVLEKLNERTPVIGALLEGESLFKSDLPTSGILVLGNESSGISEAILPFISRRIKIPGAESGRAESLNVSVAAGIICAELFRRNS